MCRKWCLLLLRQKTCVLGTSVRAGSDFEIDPDSLVPDRKRCILQARILSDLETQPGRCLFGDALATGFGNVWRTPASIGGGVSRRARELSRPTA